MHTTKTLSWLIALILTLSPLAPPMLAQDTEDRIVLELTGEVINLAPSGSAPLGSSHQFGYLAFVKGIDLVFTDTNPANQNETTALFTFFTDVQTTRVTTHGPFTITIREGTTTLYLNTPPLSFSNPDSFRSGTPIQTSTIRQQVIVDNVEKTFTVTNLNTITNTSSFTLNGATLQIGTVGQEFRTSLQGVLFVRGGGTPPPTGHFAGYAVGVFKNSE
jgi:hypothetical protein